ncbi:SLC13 family permease [Blastomonas sp.]|uniref:SLC13 family permease n=1 Tax=Blastomonas sp. TaxID=1909299 RepID=UPI00359414FA
MDVIRAFIEAWQAQIGLVILALMFVGFVMERFPAAVVAILGACTFLFLGIINSKELLSAFSNSAPITIAAMFILSGALLRTGTIDAIAGVIIARARTRPRQAVAEMFLGVYVASAFMNNTPVVVVMIPIILKLAQATGFSAKKLLIPLSFICILGGTTTLIGTSTNLIVDSVARDSGLAAFGIFEITPYGLIAGIAGMAMLVLFSSWLLPGDDASSPGAGANDELFLTELTIRNQSALRGKTLGETAIAKRARIKVTAIKRDGTYLRHNLTEELLSPDDVIVVQTDLPELMSLRASDDFKVGIVRKGDAGAKGEVVVEAMVAPSHPSIGNRLFDIPFLSLLNVRILGMSRFRNLPRSDLPNAKIHAADKLVVTGSKADIARMYENPNLFGVVSTTARALRRDKAPLALGALAAVVILSAFNVVAIEVAAILAVAGILIARCIDAEEAWSSIDGNVLVLIFGMLAVGIGLEQAGSVIIVVNALAPYLTDVPLWAVVFAVYIFSVLLTEIITNNAVAILVTPIVIKLGADLGIDPRPLVIAVMFAASASFATPIGYQTNTLVYAAGGYRFTDFFKAGIPLTIGVGLATCFAVIGFN